MKTLIIANWKCNPLTPREARRLFDSVKNGVKNIKNTEVVICPPFVYLASLQLKTYGLKLGAQDCFWEQIGAFTGEVSPAMLKNLGVEYVILGHSERRKHQKETDEMVNKKIKAVLSAGLKPILCVANMNQLKKSLKGIKNLIIAYEPTFAIGTGKPCSPQKAEKTRKAIKGAVAPGVPVLYGGSVNSQNAKDYLESRTPQKGVRHEMRRSLSEQAGFQGLLVGGASLNPAEFIKIIKNAETS